MSKCIEIKKTQKNNADIANEIILVAQYIRPCQAYFLPLYVYGLLQTNSLKTIIFTPFHEISEKYQCHLSQK